MEFSMSELIGRLKIALANTPTPQETSAFAAYLGQIGVEAPQHTSLRHVAEDIIIHLRNVNPIRRHAARVVNEFEEGTE